MSLGETIVQELGLENSNDTLGRWMAHRLAELMERAEQATEDADREAARKEATDLVLRLWDHRSSWPHGWPPEASTAIAGTSRRSRRASKDATGSPWLDSLEELEVLQSRERQIWTDLGLLDFDIESERRVVRELDGESAGEERRAIEAVIRMWESAEKGMREALGTEKTSPGARAESGMERLRETDASRDELRRRLLEDIAATESTNEDE